MSTTPQLARIGRFEGFGPSTVYLPCGEPGRCVAGGTRQDVRASLRKSCPDVPGIYGIVSAQSRLIYVGYSRQIRQRILSYFTGQKRGQKEHRIGKHAAEIHWEVVGHEFPAQLRELELIQRFAPDFNVKGRRRSREAGYLFVTGGDAPQFKFSARAPANAKQVWGPLPNLPALQTGAERLNLLFKLRDCPSHVPMCFADQPRLLTAASQPQCLRGEIGTCLAPCAGACSRKSYYAEIRRAMRLLDGVDDSPLQAAEAEMQAASAQMHFERAARLRDALDSVRGLCRSVAQLRLPPEPKAGVYEVAAGNRRLWFLFGDGLLRGMQPRPQSVPEARTTLEALRRVAAGSAEAVHALSRDSRRLVRSWFRNHPEELAQLQPLDAAGELCKQILKPTRRRA
jgi:excinuclease ABC subunit C